MLPTAPRLGRTGPRLGRTVPLLHLVLLFVATAGALLAGATPASAHAALTGSDPKQGAVVQQAPEVVTLQFSEQVSMSDDSIRVLDPKGKRVDTGKLRELGSGGTVKYGVGLHSGLPEGTFTVAWKAVSADSHPISGAFSFSVGAPSQTSVALPEQQAGGGTVGTLYDIARYVSYAAFALVVGAAAFVLACWPRGVAVTALQRLIAYSWVALAGSTVALLLLRGPYTDSGKLADVLNLGLLGEVLNTKTGAALISRMLLLGAAALFIVVLFGAYAKREDPAEKRDLTFGLAVGGGVVAAGIASTWAFAEHASTGIQTAVAMPVDVLHLLAVAVWFGGLTALLVALHRAPADQPVGRNAVRRFSRLAFGSVLVLVATGLYQSWRQVGSWNALVSTAYGQLLLVKIGLVVVLVGLASISRRWTARLTDGGAHVVEQRAAESAPTRDAPADEPVSVGAGSGSGAGAGSVESARPSAEDAPEPEPATEPTPEGDDSDRDEDPVRAAQLARQRAAVAKAGEKRVRDADPDRSGLRRTVLAEAAVAVVLLAVTTVLTATEPGRTQEQVDKAGAAGSVVASGPVKIELPFDTGGQDGKGTLRLELDPARTGANTLHVYAERPNGKAFDLPEVKLAFTLKAKDVGPLPVAPDRVSTGHWSSTGVQMPMPGDWQLSVTVRSSDIDQVTVHKNVKIG
ncbi:copper resistance CopC/CopD family protein [Streptomyces boluensis]|uniref:Protein YobA n=1 Tax=Streptomyces boluensis TaxID=1775135 RepID=A0A964XKU9_9ACTN|nr:copper resistance protein CopC [Streptomyces boluensis]NBE51441.1 hypothetical protein [Streptomyces boluensis]